MCPKKHSETESDLTLIDETETCQSRLFLAQQQYADNKQTINWCTCRVHSHNIEHMLNDNYSHFVIVVVLGFSPFGNGQAPLTSIGACLPPGGGGGGGAHQSFIGGGSALRSNPLPMEIPFLTKQVLFSWVFHIPSIDNGNRLLYLV